MHIKIELIGDAGELGLYLGEHLGSAARVEAKLDTMLVGVDGLQKVVLDILDKERQILRTEADFQQRLDQIDQNTTASAAAAQSIADALVALKTELQDAGLPAAREEAIFARLDGLANTSSALKTFLQQTASGGGTGTEPTPVPPPADNSNGGGPGPTP